MLSINLPLAGTYLFLAAGGIVVWCCWNNTNLPGEKSWFACTIIATMLLGLLIANGSTASTHRSKFAANDMQTSSPTREQYAYSTRDRTRFGSDFPEVLGYPSTGGILMLPLDIAVAEYLNIPRLENVYRDASPIDEDAFCNRLRLLGAKWWESEEIYMRKLIGIEEMTEMERQEGIIVGWPENGGVWVLRQRADTTTAMLGMCISMEERCELLKQWGAVFYEDPREVEEFEGVFLEKSS